MGFFTRWIGFNGYRCKSDVALYAVFNQWITKVSDSELEWLENDITELMEKDGPQSNSYQLFNNLKKTLAETRAKVQVLQWNPIMVGGGRIGGFFWNFKVTGNEKSGYRLKPKIEINRSFYHFYF